MPRRSGGRITAEFIRRAEELRRELKVPRPRDSADLVLESREERDAPVVKFASRGSRRQSRTQVVAAGIP